MGLSRDFRRCFYDEDSCAFELTRTGDTREKPPANCKIAMNNGPFIDDLPTVFNMVIFHSHSHVKSPNGSKWVKSSKSHLISLHEVDYIRSIITCNSSKKTQHDPAKKRQKSSTAIWMTNTSYSILEWSGIYHGHARIKCKCETNINKWLNGFRKLQQEKNISIYQHGSAVTG